MRRQEFGGWLVIEATAVYDEKHDKTKVGLKFKQSMINSASQNNELSFWKTQFVL